MSRDNVESGRVGGTTLARAGGISQSVSQSPLTSHQMWRLTACSCNEWVSRDRAETAKKRAGGQCSVVVGARLQPGLQYSLSGRAVLGQC